MDSQERSRGLGREEHHTLAARLAIAETALESVRKGDWREQDASQFAADTLAQMDRFLPLRGGR